jgi:hypothetical protein
LRYRRHHVLTVGAARWDVQVEWRLGPATPPTPDRRIRFTLELLSLGADWQTAITHARTLEPAHLDGIAARVALHTVELQFATFEEQAEPGGDATFEAIVEPPIAFPRSLEDVEFATALARAGKLAGDLCLQADEIERSDRYWIFPIHNIGANGVIVDRATGGAFVTAGSLDRATWIWAYEHQLLNEPAGDLVIEQVSDPERAFTALRGCARIRREDLANLPLVLHGSAGWMAAAGLKEAGTALTWRVAARPPSGA